MRKRLLMLMLGLLCSGCGRAEMSDARMNHLLAVDHGWLDLTVKTQAGWASPMENCSLVLVANGEQVLRESGDFVSATAQGTPLGYRFPAPAGKLDLQLELGCDKHYGKLRQSLNLAKDEMQVLTVEDGALQVGEHLAYLPASLNEIRGLLGAVTADQAGMHQEFSLLKHLLWACLAFNFVLVMLLIVLVRARGNTR